MEWIKVTQDITTYPPLGVDVLIRFKKGGYFVSKMLDDSEYGFCFADFESYFGLNDISHYCLITPPHQPKLTWQYELKSEPGLWKDATEDEYEAGCDLIRMNWKQVEK